MSCSWRRLGHIPHSPLVGLFILGHVGMRLVGESFAIAQHGADLFQPFGTALSRLWAVGWGDGVGRRAARSLVACRRADPRLHPLLTSPSSDHVGRQLSFKPKRTSPGALDLNFADESREEFGAARIEQLPWPRLMDAYGACIMCNRCQDVCPATVTGKLSPSALEINKRYYLNAHSDELAAGAASQHDLLAYAVSESALRACTACGARADIRPVGNEPMLDIMDTPPPGVDGEPLPSQPKQAFRGMERNGNPWNRAGETGLPGLKDWTCLPWRRTRRPTCCGGWLRRAP